MAVTAQGAALTEAHRVQQARQAAVRALLVQRLWSNLIDEDNITESAGLWVTRSVPIILAAFGRSAALSRSYLSTLRTLELGRLEPYTPQPIRMIPEEQVRTSLWVTGPVALEKKLKKISGLDISPTLERALITQAVEEAGSQAAGAALKHATAGGREQIKDAVKKDSRVALGWLRVPKANPCYFCAMLASRGPVYTDDSFEESNRLFTGEGVSKAHDNCACSLQPVYSRQDPGIDKAKAWEAMWGTSTAGKSGPDAVLAFRRAYEGRTDPNEE